MAIGESRKGSRSAKGVILTLIALGALSGCASNTFYWGPAVTTCSGTSSAPSFAKGTCRNGAEYEVERKKAKSSLSDAALGYGD